MFGRERVTGFVPCHCAVVEHREPELRDPANRRVRVDQVPYREPQDAHQPLHPPVDSAYRQGPVEEPPEHQPRVHDDDGPDWTRRGNNRRKEIVSRIPQPGKLVHEDVEEHKIRQGVHHVGDKGLPVTVQREPELEVTDPSDVLPRLQADPD